MKKIVILSELIGGGVEKVNRIIAENLNETKYQVIFLSIIGRGKNDFKDLGFKYESLDAKNQSKSLFKLLNKLKSISPDIIVSCGSYDTYYSLIYSKLINRNCKSIYVHHSVYSLNLNKKNIIKKVIHHYVPKAINLFNLCDKVIYVSNGVKSDLEKYYKINQNKSSIIYNPVIEKDIIIERKHKFNNNLITIGRIEEEKDQISIIKAINYLKEKGHRYNLTILGEGSLKQFLREESIKLGIDDQIKFVGYKENVYSELVKNDIFILASKHESFGNVIVEAMYAGLPIISTDCLYGPREIIGDNEYGFLVPVEDYKKMAETIVEVTAMNNMQLIEKSKRYSKKFTVEESIKSYEYLFDSL